MSDINPNESLQTNTTVEVGAGGTVKFDDLMSLEGIGAPEATAAEESAPEAQVAAPEAEPVVAEDGITLKDPKAEADKNIDTTPGAGSNALKMIKGLQGGKPYELPSDVMIEVTVDGKKQSVSIDDLRNQYSGKMGWDKKFSELDRERKGFSKEREEIVTEISTFFSLSQTDPKKAIYYLAERSGQNPHEFFSQMRNGLVPEIQRWGQLTPEQREVENLKEQNAFLQSKTQSEQSRRTAQESLQALDTKVTEVSTKLGIDRNTFKSVYEEIVATGKVAPDQITPEYVADYYKVTQSFNKAEAALESISPELKSNREAVQALVSVIEGNPDFTAEDIAEIARSTIGAQVAAKSVNRKIQKNSSGAASPKSNSRPKNPNNEPVNFDDLE